jgi:glycosyltransferase involved in cell wall biosynthesis
MKSRSRILHVASMLDPYGSSRQLRLLIEGVPNDSCHSEVIALQTLGDAHRAISRTGASVSRLHARWMADPIAAARLSLMLRERNVDLLHCWGLAALAYTCAVRPRHHDVPMLVTLTDYFSHWPLRKMLLKRLIRRVQRVVVGNQSTYQQYISMGIKAEKLEIISSGVALPALPVQSREEFLQDLELPAETRLLAVVGPLLTHKRIDDAIWCFELVRVLYDNACLLVIGDGPQRRRLERFARLVCSPGSVRFLGLRADMAEILPHVDVFWQRSEWEAGPNAMLEAMAARVPVVATNIDPHAQFIEHERTGYLTPVGNRADCTRLTDQLLSNPERARQVGAAARDFVGQQYSVERMAGAYKRLYGLLGSGSGIDVSNVQGEY